MISARSHTHTHKQTKYTSNCQTSATFQYLRHGAIVCKTLLYLSKIAMDIIICIRVTVSHAQQTFIINIHFIQTNYTSFNKLHYNYYLQA